MIDTRVLQQLAPDGVLRAAINFGNPVLAQRGTNGEPQGVSVALAKALAAELGVELEFITFEAAGKVFAALAEDDGQLANVDPPFRGVHHAHQALPRGRCQGVNKPPKRLISQLLPMPNTPIRSMPTTMSA